MLTITAPLDNLTDIVSEYTIDKKKHIYGWRGRHPVISSIITRYKFGETGKLVDLFEKVIDNTLPTYDIEVRSIIALCNINTGIPKIPDKNTQNHLLRKMVSALPGQRVPRHRLIRNLTDLGKYDEAQTEIRIFEKDFRIDAPVTRLKIELLVARATHTPGIMSEDRLSVLELAREIAVSGITRHSYAKAIFGAYCNVGFTILNLNGSSLVFNEAMRHLRLAEKRLFDPDIALIIRKYDGLRRA